MDGLIVRSHPAADPKTGAVHACGHCGQGAALLGIAAALKEPGALDGLSGSIRLMIVPAEEMIQLGFREELRQKGIVGYMGGKVEFMHPVRKEIMSITAPTPKDNLWEFFEGL